MARRPEKYAPREQRFTLSVDADPVDDTAERERQRLCARRACAAHLADLMREYCPAPRSVISGFAA
jgi:hypothetical protein